MRILVETTSTPCSQGYILVLAIHSFISLSFVSSSRNSNLDLTSHAISLLQPQQQS